MEEKFKEDDKVEIIFADDKSMVGKVFYINRSKQYLNFDSPIYQLCGVKGWWREYHLKKV